MSDMNQSSEKPVWHWQRIKAFVMTTTFLLLAGGFVAGIIFWGGFNTVLEMTNREEFCISCHEMKENVFVEYRNTIRDLIGLWHDRERPSRQVKALAREHLAAIDAKLAELQAVKATLERLVQCCHGDERPDCPILDSLAGERPAG